MIIEGRRRSTNVIDLRKIENLQTGGRFGRRPNVRYGLRGGNIARGGLTSARSLQIQIAAAQRRVAEKKKRGLRGGKL